MEYEQKVKIEEKDILTPLQLLLAIERINWQMSRLVSDAESEEGTFQREVKRIKDDITKLEQEFRTAMYDPDKGMIVKMNTLYIKNEENEKFKNQIKGLWVSVTLLFIAFILNWILKK